MFGLDFEGLLILYSFFQDGADSIFELVRFLFNILRMALLASFRRLETIQNPEENISCTPFLWRSGEHWNRIADIIPIYFTENQAYKFSGESMYIEMLSRQLIIRNIAQLAHVQTKNAGGSDDYQEGERDASRR